jgi:hypothetical protein
LPDPAASAQRPASDEAGAPARPAEPTTGPVPGLGSPAPTDLPSARARIADLERAIASERARTVARAREVEAGVRVLRDALQDLQGERQRMRDEVARLQDQLDQSRKAVATLTDRRAAPGVEAALEEARAVATRLTERVDALEAAVADRDAQLAHAAARIADLEARGGAPAPEAGPGPQLPGLRVERVVSEGPEGYVLDARETGSRRPVTVRLLPTEFRRCEGKLLDSLLLAKHANLVSVLSFAVCPQGPYLVFEREQGETATQWVARVGALPERVALAVVLEAARGLRHAALHGAVHGDLGADDVLIETSGRVRVRGIGLAGLLHPDDPAPCAPAFAAPERLRGEPATDSRADVWSLGAVLAFLLTGGTATHGATPDVHGARPDVSEATVALIHRLCASNPELRPPSWDQVLAELARLAPADRADEDVALPARFGRAVARRPWVAVAAVAAAIAAFGFWRALSADERSAADRYRDASAVAERLLRDGDVEGARAVYRRFLRDTGDASVEREAAQRHDALGGR